MKSYPTPDIQPGAWPVLFTPFTEHGEVDHPALDDLVDFYVQGGAAGLFASCLSSEVFNMTFDEMLEISRRLVKRANGRIRIVAGGNIGSTLEEQANALGKMCATGVDASVVILSMLPESQDIGGQLLRLCELTAAPLGVYECPVPEHRLLSPDEVGAIARTGRFCFMKETSRSTEVCAAKAREAKGTPLRVFQANLMCTPDSLDLGAAGHCGVIANVSPEMCAMLCDTRDAQLRGVTFRSLIALHNVMASNTYPISGKYILQKRGVRLTTVSRCVSADRFTEDNRRALDEFLAGFDFHRSHLNEFDEIPVNSGDPRRSD